MNIQWVADQLNEKEPVRRKSWGPGEFIGADERGIFYSMAHEETYSAPSVIIDYNFSTEDLRAEDWEFVKILPKHAYIIRRTDYNDNYPKFFWTMPKAKKFIDSENFGQFEIIQVTKNLFCNDTAKMS